MGGKSVSKVFSKFNVHTNHAGCLEGRFCVSRVGAVGPAFLASAQVSGCCWAQGHTLSVDSVQYLGLTLGSRELAMVLGEGVEQGGGHCAHTSLTKITAMIGVRPGDLGLSHFCAHLLV